MQGKNPEKTFPHGKTAIKAYSARFPMRKGFSPSSSLDYSPNTQIGDIVEVVPWVLKPRWGWGSISHSSRIDSLIRTDISGKTQYNFSHENGAREEGVVIGFDERDGDLIVRFPSSPYSFLSRTEVSIKNTAELLQSDISEEEDSSKKISLKDRGKRFLSILKISIFGGTRRKTLPLLHSLQSQLYDRGRRMDWQRYCSLNPFLTVEDLCEKICAPILSVGEYVAIIDEQWISERALRHKVANLRQKISGKSTSEKKKDLTSIDQIESLPSLEKSNVSRQFMCDHDSEPLLGKVVKFDGTRGWVVIEIDDPSSSKSYIDSSFSSSSSSSSLPPQYFITLPPFYLLPLDNIAEKQRKDRAHLERGVSGSFGSELERSGSKPGGVGGVVVSEDGLCVGLHVTYGGENSRVCGFGEPGIVCIRKDSSKECIYVPENKVIVKRKLM
ncbi:hypothetical protein ADUPG1_010368, partial [Aduncisulcus paluster]